MTLAASVDRELCRTPGRPVRRVADNQRSVEAVPIDALSARSSLVLNKQPNRLLRGRDELLIAIEWYGMI